eukprot:m.131330 g.131330  ORF g.131330 m.131330 type:complete len:84 (+) comp15742_c8_seq8:204-455(+)
MCTLSYLHALGHILHRIPCKITYTHKKTTKKTKQKKKENKETNTSIIIIMCVVLNDVVFVLVKQAEQEQRMRLWVQRVARQMK